MPKKQVRKSAGTPRMGSAAFAACKETPLQLTPAEAKALDGCDLDDVVRVGDALVGFARGTEENEWESRVIVYRDKRARTLELAGVDDFCNFAVAPSGTRFLVLDKTGLGFGSNGACGRATEVDVRNLDMRVAVTALEHTETDTRLWAVEYLDDDTLVAAISSTDDAYLLLLERDAKTQQFLEVDNIKAKGLHVATDGNVVAIGAKHVTLFHVVDHRLVELGKATGPRGAVYTYRTRAGREIHAHDGDKRFCLAGLQAFADVPARTLPSTLLRRVAGEHVLGPAIPPQKKPEDTHVVVIHPAGKRAIAYDTSGKQPLLVEIELKSQKRVTLAKGEVAGWYAMIDGRELLCLEHEDRVVRVYDRQPMQAALGACISSFDLRPAQAHPCGVGGFLLVKPPVGKPALHFVRLRARGADVELVESPRLSLPGTRYAKAFVFSGKTVGECGYVIVHAKDTFWFRAPDDYAVAYR